MDFKGKTRELQALYRDFEEKTRAYRKDAVCLAGCADCCTNVGSVDAVSLEGWLILERLKTMDPARRSQFKRKLEENARIKREAIYARCAFLMDNGNCAIYPVRPFSCRRLYSLVRCGESGPTVHRQVWKMAEETVAALQRLDDGGCSGHLSHILLFLQDSALRKAYLDGTLTPELVLGSDHAVNLSFNSFGKPPKRPRVD
jgi:uncharacterized protein